MNNGVYRERSVADAALTAAIDRDLRDAERLAHLLNLVTNLMDAIIEDIHDFEHPNIRYQPVDLMDTLLDAAAALRSEQRNLTGPVVVEDCP